MVVVFEVIVDGVIVGYCIFSYVFIGVFVWYIVCGFVDYYD